MKAIQINEHVISFFIGRPDNAAEFINHEVDWPTDGAILLGLSSYAIVNGMEAIVYDTMTTRQQAQWVKDYLINFGVKKFHVVLSHWHLDHIVGTELYFNENIIGHMATREKLIEHRSAIESGTLWGPPGVPVVLPNITYQDRMDLYLNGLKVELHNFNIHSQDATILYLPSEELILAGDTLEDTLTYISAPGDLPTHLSELQRLKTLRFQKILPNHGHPEIISRGGYEKSFIDATIEYLTQMLARVNTPGYLESPMEDYVGKAVERGWIHLWEPYRRVHRQNLKQVFDFYQGKPMPGL